MLKRVRMLSKVFALGAAAMYFFDPDLGKRRRSQVRDQFTSARNSVTELFEEGSKDLENRVTGVAHVARSKARNLQTGVTEPFRSGGQEEEGVRDAGSATGAWPPGPRVLALGAAAYLYLSGLGHRGLMGTFRRYLGTGLVVRVLANRPIAQLLGLDRRHGAVEIRKGIVIDAPIEDVFSLWCSYSNFPRFMANILSIDDLGEGRSRWTVRGPAGTEIEWYAHVVRSIPEKMISWETEPGSLVYQTGTVRFHSTEEGRTVVNIQISYSPPAGVVGHAVATLFGTNPKKQIHEDLVRLKSLFERGRTSAGGKTVTREEILQGVDGQCLASVGQANQPAQHHNGGRERNRGRETTGSSGVKGSPATGEGGEGRRDVIGGDTGVYPASGPLPPGDAEVRGMASWGQGERGAAGYEDSGTSEIWFHDEELKKGEEGEEEQSPE